MFYKETIFLPFGFQSTQVHMNNWDDDYFNKFREFLIKSKQKILDYNKIVSQTSDSEIKKILRDLFKFSLTNFRKLNN